MVLHRKTNYIEFISGLNTNATNRGEKYTALKGDYGWKIYDAAADKIYQCAPAILRVLIEQGEELKQEQRHFTLAEKLKYSI